MNTDFGKRQRRVSLTIEQIELAAAALSVLTAQPAVTLKGIFDQYAEEGRDPEHWRIVDAYTGAVDTNDDLSVDSDAEVSLGDDPGAYVMIWKWVAASDADLCEQCNGATDDGEGYDGLCGDCADKAEGEE